MNPITREHLEDIADRLVATVTNPAFLTEVEQVHKAGDHDAQYAIAEKINVDSLAKAGVKIPQGFRAVPRTFEDPAYAEQNGVQSMGKEPGSNSGAVAPETYDTSSWAESPLEGQPEKRLAPDEIGNAIRMGMSRIADFVTTEKFQNLLAEMSELPPTSRPEFVLDVVLNQQELESRGVVVPHDMMIQRSTFHDGRPTLFCVSALTALAYPWRKVTYTFDND